MVDDSNREVYEQPTVINVYQPEERIQPGELAIFEPLADEMSTARLLDIGVGAGRTSAYLMPRVADYVGVDYSHGLVEVARSNHPDGEFHWCDARDMTMFATSSFDMANFSFNGIDSVPHEDRLQILAEVRRVLKPGGMLTFSSHNRDYHRMGLLPWQGKFKPGRVMLKKSLEAWSARSNWRRLRAQQRHTDEYALINDEAHAYSLLHYYIAPAAQERQLQQAGFSDVTVRDQYGDLTTSSRESIWMYYTARRA